MHVLQKDSAIIAEFARSLGVDTPMLDAAAPLYDEADALGYRRGGCRRRSCRARPPRRHRDKDRIEKEMTLICRCGPAPAPVSAGAGRLHYAWIVAAVTFAIVVLTAGVRAAPGVLIVPLEHEFHWSRATISFAVGVNVLLYGAIGPFAAALIDRFGVRRTVTAVADRDRDRRGADAADAETWQLVLLWGVVVGIGCGFTGAYLGPLIAARWFKARQGLVIGVLTAGNAAGQLVFLPTMAALATSAGWRVMSLTLAVASWCSSRSSRWLMRDRPDGSGCGLWRDGGPQAPRRHAAGNPIRVSFRALGDGRPARAISG